MKPSLLLLGLVLFLSCTPYAQAATINAANCSQSAVQSAINSAGDGDTVIVPSGSCTWPTPVTVDLSSGMALTIQGVTSGCPGSCSDGTIITAVIHAFSVTGGSGKLFRLTGITFNKVGEDYNSLLDISGSNYKARIDHNHFSSLTYRTAIIDSGWTDFLWDHNYWNNDITDEGGILIRGSNDESWQEPINWGGSDWVFFEDNVFVTQTYSNEGIDCSNGGKYVFRHNTVQNMLVGGHGFDSSTRSCKAMEVYSNSFSNPYGHIWPSFVQMRGGTALIHDNSFSDKPGIWVTNYRSQSNALAYTSWRGFADGTKWKTCTDLGGQGVIACTSDADCLNEICSGGDCGLCDHWWCSITKDQRCATNADCPVGETCTAFLDGSGTHGYPPRDVIGRGPNQNSAPVYQWNNIGDADIVVYSSYDGTDYSADHIQEGRDYFNNVQYSYTTYTYPHPLQGTSQQTCSDGTPYSSCSSTKPLYCSSGTLISNCQTCGCPTGQSCQSGGTCQSSSQYFLPYQYVQAESGVLSGMQTGTSGPDTYLYTSTENSGSASYTFQIQDAGKYMMQARVKSNSDTGSNSFFVGLDSEPAQGNNAYTYSTLLTSVFAWDDVNKVGSGTSVPEFDPMLWDLTLGLHNFTFYGRESNTWLDQIILRKACGKADSNCDSCVSSQELTAFIGRWYASDTDVTLKELMEAIGLWKQGC